jgi:transposase
VIAELQVRVSKLEVLVEQQAVVIQQQVLVIQQQAAEIERLTRGGKRQAAPFSKGPPKAKPKTPGRKKGKDYGKQAKRSTPDKVDRAVELGCPLYCPHCASRVILEDKASQFQVDLPKVAPQTTEFIVHGGRCSQCGRRVHGRHEEQVSDALTVGNVHLGPGVIGLAAHLNKVCGMSYGKIAALLASWMGLAVHRSSLCRANERLARKSKPTEAALVESSRFARRNGRRDGLEGWWSARLAVRFRYRTRNGLPDRSWSQVCSGVPNPGEDYSGVLTVDGWAPYRRFTAATLQACLTHFLRRCSELIEKAKRGAARFPRQVKATLKEALEVRDRREQGTISRHGVRVVRGQLQAKINRLLEGRFTNAENLRLAKHLRNYQDALFDFLSREGVEATNWRGEHAMRAGIMTRKFCGGGNRTESGAETQATLMTVLRTIHQKVLDPRQILTELLGAPKPFPNRLLVEG